MMTPAPTIVNEDALETYAERVDAARREVERLEEPARTKALDLMRAVETFHKLGLTKIVQRLKADPRGKELLFELVDESSVYALFAMHGLVRADPMEQTQRVLESVRPYLRSHGGDVELVKVEGNVAHVRLQGACNGCSLAAVTLRDGVEKALVENLPHIQRVEVVLTEPSAGMVWLDSITVNDNGHHQEDDRLAAVGWVQGPALSEVEAGRLTRLDAEGTSAVILNLGGQLYAYRNQCAHQGLPLDGSLVDEQGGTLTCPWHGFCYDARSGEGLSAPEAQLEALPLVVREGRLWVKVR